MAIGLPRSEITAGITMVVPFVTFFLSMLLAWRGRDRSAVIALLAALALSMGMFVYHITDTLPISL